MNAYLLFVTVLILFCNSLAYAVSTEENLTNNKYGLAKIEVTIKDKSPRYGTGFFFYQDKDDKSSYLLTADHVVKDDVENEVVRIKLLYLNSRNNTFEDCDAEMIKSDKEHDLALLKTSCIPDHFLELGDSTSIPSGTRLDVIGWSEGARPEPVVHKLENIKPLKKGGRTVLSMSTITHGDSGAPALNDKGKVIAIVPIGEILTKTPAAVPISFATDLVGHAMQAAEKARYEELYDKVKNHEALMEQLKQNIQAIVEWKKFANPLEGASESIPLTIRFEKSFDEQYLPSEVKLTLVPNWQVTSKDEKQTLLFSSEDHPLKYEPPPIVITKRVAEDIQKLGYLSVIEMHGWITTKLEPQWQESTQRLKIDSATGTIELAIPQSGDTKNCKRKPKPFRLGEP